MRSERELIPTGQNNKQKSENIMGDKSPKSNQKKSNQKSAKNNAANDKKKKASAAQKAPGKK